MNIFCVKMFENASRWRVEKPCKRPHRTKARPQPYAIKIPFFPHFFFQQIQGGYYGALAGRVRPYQERHLTPNIYILTSGYRLDSLNKESHGWSFLELMFDSDEVGYNISAHASRRPSLEGAFMHHFSSCFCCRVRTFFIG